jgi:hypothetical protein
MVNEQKQPQAGEWWEMGESGAEGLRVFIVGIPHDGVDFVCQEEDGEPHIRHLNGWRHLPDCTGWDSESDSVESPHDWVTQDRVPPRSGVDEISWSGWLTGHWIPAQGIWADHMLHGKARTESTLFVRCRRKDLPPIPPVKIPVRLWVSERITYEPGSDWPVRCGENPPSGQGSWVEIHPSPDGFFVTKQS